MEIYVLELKKLPLEQKNEPLVVKWMWFLAAERREDFEKMAEEDMTCKPNKQNCRFMDIDLSVKRQFCFIGGEIRK